MFHLNGKHALVVFAGHQHDLLFGRELRVVNKIQTLRRVLLKGFKNQLIFIYSVICKLKQYYIL